MAPMPRYKYVALPRQAGRLNCIGDKCNTNDKVQQEFMTWNDAASNLYLVLLHSFIGRNHMFLQMVVSINRGTPK